jgi:ATP-dependent protease ClpP protease subunit
MWMRDRRLTSRRLPATHAFMNYAARRKIYRKIEAARGSRVITFVTGDRPGLETQIAPDCVSIFVELLDDIGPTEKLSLILHTNGGHTSAAWRIVNLIRTFCDELEVINLLISTEN